MSRIIVTGASGFIGQNLVNRLKQMNYDVIEVNHSDGDISEPKILDSYKNVTHVVHLAGKNFIPSSWENPYDFLNSNLLGTQNVIDYCIKNNSKLIFSSAYLYGVPEYLPINEKHTIKSNNPYALSKHFAEKLIKFNCEYNDLDAVSLRFFNVYGVGQKSDYLIPTIFEQIKKNKEIEVNNLEPKRDYVYIDDVVDCIVLALNKNIGYQVFNVGSGVSYSVKELIELIKLVSGSSLSIKSREIFRENEVLDVIADIKSIKETLDWKPKYSLESGLREIYIQSNLQ